MKTYKTIEDDPKEITQFNELDLSKTYSYADYLKWQFKERVELIKGHIFKMSPAPGRFHQEVSSVLHGVIWQELKNRKCKIFSAPFDVRLPRKSKDDDKIYDIVQPDLCVICDLSKLDDRGCLGAPDLIIEILSPGSTQRDLRDKYDLYESNKVKEYWVVDPKLGTLLIYTLDEQGKYIPSRLFTKGDKIGSSVIVGFELELEQVFDFE